MAAVTSLPSFRLSQVHGCLEAGVLGTVSAVVGDSAADRASLLRTLRTRCALELMFDILGRDPGAAVSS
jgi:hypothetical protein